MKRGPNCEGCPFLKETVGFASTRGELRHDVMIVLEALGEEEVLLGTPAVGPTGKLLNRMISRLRDPDSGELFKPEDFLVTNVNWCRPVDLATMKNRTPTEDEQEYCSKRYLLPLIEELKPKVILACGAVPMGVLTGHNEVRKLRGYPLPMIKRDKFSLEHPGIPVIGTYHPAFVMKGNWPLTRVWQMDLRKALHIARKGSMPTVERHYDCDISADLFAAWCSMAHFNMYTPGTRLSFDIETPHSSAMKDEIIDAEDLRLEDDESYNIFRISFAISENNAVSVPWSPAYLPGIQALLAHPCDKVVWNRHFDIPRVTHNGAPVNGRVYDGMDMWHFTEPGFPMGLKYAATFFCPDMPPWVLEKNANPAWYNAADSDVALRVVHGCEERLKAEGRWATFESHFVELGTRLGWISARGIPTDPRVRADKRDYFEALFQTEIAEVQPLIPDSIRPCSPPYKKTEEALRASGKWVEGRMVPVKVRRKETRDDIPEGERCDRKGCGQRWTLDRSGKRRCSKHSTKTMLAAGGAETKQGALSFS